MAVATAPRGTGNFHDPVQQLPVRQMDSIEVADGQHAAQKAMAAIRRDCE